MKISPSPRKAKKSKGCRMGKSSTLLRFKAMFPPNQTGLVGRKTSLGWKQLIRLSDLVVPRAWEVPTNESESAEFTVDEVLSLKPGEIRIGLDFSPTTGTFAAIMKEKNVTIAS
ncbi:hypothetical protein C3L33_18729, partial [Rhododendron williamsianum]